MQIAEVILSGRVVTAVKLAPPTERTNGKEMCVECHHQFRRHDMTHTVDGFVCPQCTDES